MLDKGLNQQKLARLSGVSDSEISRILSGKSANPGLDNALKLARAVGVSLDFLADDSIDEDESGEGAGASPAVSEVHDEVLGLAQDLGLRQARRILETVCELGYDVAMRRLLDMRPLIEVGDPPRPISTDPIPSPLPPAMTPDRRAS